MKKNNNTKELAWCSLFCALIGLGAFLKIPIPMVPFTLQVFFTTLAGLLLGPVLGARSALGYLLLGLLGFPIFAEGGGIFYVLKPSFGYIIGFVAGTYCTGRLVSIFEKPKFYQVFLSNIAGLLVVYGFGMIYYYGISHFYLATNIGLWPLILYCFLLCVPGDLLLCALAAVVYQKVGPYLKQTGWERR